ncbi:hypothetical protein A9Q99_03080 [Gammaproteobacteria bacterium 45_16_T64]|nr:hypothetical protein A9Q99_03080 [Gammaproteobacteria bacterium 45_16_T64]
MTSQAFCPCGSSQSYATCCQPYHLGSQVADSAETLMRSRYSAYAKGHINYLLSTRHKSTRHLDSVGSLQQSIQRTQWTKLSITHCAQGKAADKNGTVTFEAHYLEQGKHGILTETSRFIREGQQWYYVDGDYDSAKPVTLGRNEPCWCGSDKKFKRCHG